MNLPVLFQIFAGIILVLFLVALVMGSKSWKIHTVMMSLLVFLCAMTLLVLSGMVLRTHSVWREALEGPPGERGKGWIYNTQQFERETQELRYGKRNQEGELVEDGILQKKQQLRQTMFDRGRVWKNCTPTAGGDPTRPVVLVDQPKPHRIRKGSTLYVFEPKTVADGGTYLGEFKVTEVVDPGAEANAEAGEGGAAAGGLAGAAGGVNTVSLEASWKMTDEEVDRLERSVNRRGPWTLYEKMPADSHTLFDDITAEELGPNDPQPRELEKVDRLKKLLPADVVQEYVKDHEQPEEDDPPDRIEMYVRFKKNYEKPVPNQEPLKYERRQEMWLPKVSAVDETGEPLIPGADELESLEIVEIKDRRYSRQLRDYSLLFRKIYRERDQLLARKAALASDIQNMQTVLTDKNKRIEDFQGENERLQNDKKGFARDLDLLSSLLAKIEQENTDAARRSENLRKQNIQLGERLDQAQMKAVRRMNDRAPAPQARRQEAPPTKNPPQLATSG